MLEIGALVAPYYENMKRSFFFSGIVVKKYHVSRNIKRSNVRKKIGQKSARLFPFPTNYTNLEEGGGGGIGVEDDDGNSRTRREREGEAANKKIEISRKACSRGGRVCDHTRMAEGSGCRRYILVDTDTCCPTPFSDVVLFWPSGRLVNIQCAQLHAILYTVRSRRVKPRDGIQPRAELQTHS